MKSDFLSNSMTLLSSGTFELPPDGWYQISSTGDFPHRERKLTQVIDSDSCAAMAAAFQKEASIPNFAGLLVDFDHDSLNPDKRSEAAGWITALEARPTGLWAQIRWSDEGAKAVTGGRYRFISPVWRQDECADLGNSRVRPLHLINAGLTNDPNISGMVPLSNTTKEPIVATLIMGNADHPRLFKRAVLTNSGPVQKSLANCRVSIAFLENGSPTMTDEERKAMFAHMRGGYRRGAGESSSSHDTERPALDYSTRESAERMEALKKEREFILGRSPGPAPEPRTFEKIDLRAMEREMLKSGMPFAQIESEMAALEAKNRERAQDYRRIKNLARSKTSKTKSFKTALAAELDKIALHNEKEAEAYSKYKSSWDKELARIDAEIENEKIAAKEYDKKAALKMAEEAEKDLSRSEREARAAKRAAEVAADKERIRKERDARAAKKAREESEAAADPVKQFTLTDRKRQAYWNALKVGDLDSASAIFPTANHTANLEYLKTTGPKNKSNRELAQAERVFKETKHSDPLLEDR